MNGVIYRSENTKIQGLENPKPTRSYDGRGTGFTALAELSTRQIAETMETKGLEENKIPARKGGE